MPRRRWLRSLSVLALVLAGCASVPVPEAQLASADLAYRKAEQAGASRYAPLDMRVAREKLEDARLAVGQERNEEARWLAEQAEVDSLLAEARARTARRQAAAAEIEAQIDALRSEAERAGKRIEGGLQ